MAVVHHGSYVAYWELARVEYLRRRGIDYAVLSHSGVHMPVVELTIRYLRPLRFDDELEIEVRLGALTGATVRFDYRLFRLADRQLTTEGSTLLACVGHDLRPRRVPSEALTALLGAERGIEGPSP